MYVTTLASEVATIGLLSFEFRFLFYEDVVFDNLLTTSSIKIDVIKGARAMKNGLKSTYLKI